MELSTRAPPPKALREVLVVEDDCGIREALRDLLESEGLRVTGAVNGEDALAKLRGRAPDLILLDLMMPVMNGWEFRIAQRRDPAIAGIPVVVLSAQNGLGREVRDMSVDGWLAKPFEIDALLAAVHRYC